MLFADKKRWALLALALLPLAGVRSGAQVELTDKPDVRFRIDTGGHIGAVHSLIFTPADPANPKGRLISCGADKVARVHALTGSHADAWRYQIGDGFEGQFYAAALNPKQPSQLALGSSGKDKGDPGDILLTDVVTGALTQRLKGHKGTITSLAYAPDASLLASCGTDHKVVLWSLDSSHAGGKSAKMKTKSTSANTAVSAVDNRRNIPGGRNTGASVSQTLTVDDDEYMTGVAFGANGSWVAAASWRVNDDEHQGVLRIWQLDAAHHAKSKRVFTCGSDILCLAASPPSRRYPQGLLAYGAEDGIIHLRDPAEKFAEQAPFTVQNDSVTCLAFNSKGTRLISGGGSRGADVSARVWSLENDRQIQIFKWHTTTIHSVAFRPDAETTAGGDDEETVVSGDAYGMVYLWNAKTGEKLRSFQGPGEPVFSVAWSSDGNRVAWGHSFGNTKLENVSVEHAFDLNAGIPDPNFNAAKYEWTEARHTLAGGGKRKTGPFSLQEMPDHTGVIVRDASGRATHRITLGVTDRLRCFSFTPDGKKVVVGSDLYLSVYDISGQRAHKIVDFEGHEGPVLALAVDPQGRYVASGGVDQTVRLWSLKSTPRAGSANPEDMGAANAEPLRLNAPTHAFQHMDTATFAIVQPQKPFPSDSALLGIFAGEGGVWAAWAQNGYYASSPAGDYVLGWHINRGADKPAEFRTSFQCPQFYQPDVIAQIGKTGDLKSALAAVFVKDRPTELDTPLPVQIAAVPKLDKNNLKVEANEGGRTVELRLDTDGAYHTNAEKITLHLRYQTPDPLLNVQTTLNHSKLFGVVHDGRGRALEPETSETYDRKTGERVRVVDHLNSGKNTIHIFARNDSGMSDEAVNVVVKGSGSSNLPHLYMLAVGISEYINHDLHLYYAASDAQKMQEFFQASGKNLFSGVDTVLLRDQTATKENIQFSLKQLLDKVGPADTVLLYFSCHGFTGNDGAGRKTFYLAPVNVITPDKGSGRNTVENGYSWREILDQLAKVDAKHIILMVDHCFAGGVSKTLDAAPNTRFQTQTETMRAAWKNNILVFAASASTEVSYESDDLKQGVFTYYILKALNGGMTPDLYTNDTVLLRALDYWVPQQVTAKYAAQHPNLFGLSDADKAVPLAKVNTSGEK